MWRIARDRRIIPLVLIVAIVAASILATPQAYCQTPFCQLVYYTVTSTIVNTQIHTAVEDLIINGTTTTRTRTYTTVVTQVVPGGVLANLSCSVPPPPTPAIVMPTGPSLGSYPTDSFSLLMAAVSIGAFAAAIVSNLSRTVVYLLAAAAVVSSLAAAYPPLSAVAQAGAALALFAAAVIFAISK
jgi:hypothetical protein